ncbi:importin subunit beta-1 [Artemisia annua]|uniref:Importin subunit beta-1 n=1 Tax=Artemisia annua TaxID=35608 RepID=A0A2U1P2L5_ARTAN|nr:importin subunit beta-1 [Artemisia annua]
MANEVTQVLLNAQSVDGSVRKQAEESLKQFQEQNLADSEVPCFYFIKQALPALVPMLLETLLKQEEVSSDAAKSDGVPVILDVRGMESWIFQFLLKLKKHDF